MDLTQEINHIKKFSRIFGYFAGTLLRLFKALIFSESWNDCIGSLKLIGKQTSMFMDELNKLPILSPPFGDLSPQAIESLETRIRGLHAFLPNANKYHYSVLIPVYQPKPLFLEKALRSALSQTAPQLEILVGLDGPQPTDVLAVIEKAKALATSKSISFKVFEIDRQQTGGGISRTTNFLAAQAQGNYYLFMDHDDWITPDLLYRYEQCLRLYTNPETVILYCNEYKINENDKTILFSNTSKPYHPVFPYVFINFICHCLLVPAQLWQKTGGLRPECDGAQDYDLCLRLDIAGAKFQLVPFHLYAWRAHQASTAKNLETKDYATPAGIKAFQDYCVAKKLDWKISEGFLKTTYRAIPELKETPKIHVIIPFKDQKDLTLRAVKSVLAQKGVQVFITAIDNRSQDKTCGQDLNALGVEVLELNEPFNYSRINNFGVAQSKYSPRKDRQNKDSKGIPLLLFLNNDVELDSDALLEMARWIDQPKIGMVGARLHYPDGKLQHGGVFLNMELPATKMGWSHVDGRSPKKNLGYSLVTSICDAVTAACMLIKRENFNQVGGFDEIWYPIAFSDTDLAVRVLDQLGLYALYTPYAVGIHFESASRGPAVHEEMEASTWLFKNTQFRDQPQERLKHAILPLGEL